MVTTSLTMVLTIGYNHGYVLCVQPLGLRCQRWDLSTSSPNLQEARPLGLHLNTSSSNLVCAARGHVRGKWLRVGCVQTGRRSCSMLPQVDTQSAGSSLQSSARHLQVIDTGRRLASGLQAVCRQFSPTCCHFSGEKVAKKFY